MNFKCISTDLATPGLALEYIFVFYFLKMIIFAEYYEKKAQVHHWQITAGEGERSAHKCAACLCCVQCLPFFCQYCVFG